MNLYQRSQTPSRRPAMRPLGVLVVSLLLGASAPAQGLITPLGPDPEVDPTVINLGPIGQTVSRIDQIAMLPSSPASSSYYVCCTVWYGSTPTDTSLLTGTLDLGVTPPVWTPDNSVASLNMAATVTRQDEFALTMSTDRLVIVWDNYAGATYPPNVTTTAYTFVCTRSSPTAPFLASNVQAVTPMTGGWSDAHLGAPLGNGSYELYFSDPIFSNDIMCGALDPATGAVTAPVLVKSRSAGSLAAHSPCVLRDSQGRARALSFGEVAPAYAYSSMLWTSNMVDAGTTVTLADGSPSSWYSNGTSNGGTLRYGGPLSGPHKVEVTLLADTIPRTGAVTIPGWAPLRPAASAPQFLSWVIVGFSTTTLPIPNIPEALEVLPDVILGFAIHDRFTGLAEWPLTVPAGLVLPPLFTQMLTYDVQAATMHFSNLAKF